MLSVETERLLLLPMTYDCMTALLEQKETELEHQGYTLSEDWITLEVLQTLDILRSLMPKDAAPDGFYTWAVIEKQTKQVIGDVGFKGRPNDLGAIDIGYGLAESARGKGLATEAVLAMVEWAFSKPEVRRVSAESLHGNAASTCILQKIGMRQMLRDGDTVYWEIKREVYETR